MSINTISLMLILCLLVPTLGLSKTTLKEVAEKELTIPKKYLSKPGEASLSTINVKQVKYIKPDYEFNKKFLIGFQTTGFEGNLRSLGQSSTDIKTLDFSSPVVIGLELPLYSPRKIRDHIYLVANLNYAASGIDLRHSAEKDAKDTQVNLLGVAVGAGYIHPIAKGWSLAVENLNNFQRSVIPTEVSALQNSSTNIFSQLNLIVNYKVYKDYNLQLAQVLINGGQQDEITPTSGSRILLRKEL